MYYAGRDDSPTGRAKQVNYTDFAGSDYIDSQEIITETQGYSENGEIASGEYIMEEDMYSPSAATPVRGNGIQNYNPSPEPFPGANRIYTQPNTDSYCGASLLGRIGYGGYYPAYGTVGNCAVYSSPYDRRCNTLFGSGQGFFTGWVNAGATFAPNDDNFPNRYNDQANEFVMNQLYLSFGRMVNKNSNRFDVGARVDLLYGTDYFFTSSLGLETETYREDANGSQFPTDDPTEAHLKWNQNDGKRRDGTAALYGLSMPQLYAEFFLPIQCGLTVKAGHFYSIMGYESVMAPQNFFYSRTYTTTYGEPTTHTGILLSQQISPNFSIHGGITRGWNTWENADDGTSGIIGVQYDTCLDSSIAFTLHTGKTSVQDTGTRTNYSLVLSQQINPAWKYVIQHDLGTEPRGAQKFDQLDEIRTKATWCSIVQYLEGQLTPACALGLRFEWFQDMGHSRILQFPYSSTFGGGHSVIVEGKNYFDISLGMKWKPVEYITIRPEVRWDWSDVKITSTVDGVPSRPGIFDNFTKKSQCTAAIDFIVMF